MDAAPPRKSGPRVAVVIVNYRAARLIIENFAALAEECRALPAARVYIVDNASPDGEGALLEGFAAAGERRGFVRVIRSAENGGFARGNNLALRAALAEDEAFDYFFLMNPDAYVRPGAIPILIDLLEAEPKAGFAGARLEYPGGAPQASAFRFLSVAGEIEAAAKTGLVSLLLAPWRVAPPQRDRREEVDWVCGAAVLVRRAVFEEVGLFDEDYFLYFEETDLMLAARRKGWRVWYAPEARAVHLVGRSTGVVDGRREDRPPPDYWYRSRARYFRKNHGRLYAALADWGFLLGASVDWLRRALSGGDAAGAAAAMARFLASRPGAAPKGGGT
jgi:hypothetical protein